MYYLENLSRLTVDSITEYDKSLGELEALLKLDNYLYLL